MISSEQDCPHLLRGLTLQARDEMDGMTEIVNRPRILMT